MCWAEIGIMEKNMASTTLYRVYIGVIVGHKGIQSVCNPYGYNIIPV